VSGYKNKIEDKLGEARNHKIMPLKEMGTLWRGVVKRHTSITPNRVKYYRNSYVKNIVVGVWLDGEMCFISPSNYTHP
jgi:hypothetical protein